jgi:hypothetical protein
MEDKENCTITRVCVDSKDRQGFPSSDSSNYKIKLPKAINKVKSVVLREVIFPNVIFNLNFNNLYLDFEVASNIYTFSISPGAYEITQLAAIIEAGMNALASGFTVTYNSATFGLDFFNSLTAFTLLFSTGPNADRSIASLIGYGAANYFSSGSAPYTRRGPGAVRVSYPRNLFITIDEIGTGNWTTSGFQYTFDLTVRTNSSGYTYIDPATWEPQGYEIGARTSINSLTVKITGDNGEALILSGADWIMKLEFFS